MDEPSTPDEFVHWVAALDTDAHALPEVVAMAKELQEGLTEPGPLADPDGWSEATESGQIAIDLLKREPGADKPTTVHQAPPPSGPYPPAPQGPPPLGPYPPAPAGPYPSGPYPAGPPPPGPYPVPPAGPYPPQGPYPGPYPPVPPPGPYPGPPPGYPPPYPPAPPPGYPGAPQYPPSGPPPSGPYPPAPGGGDPNLNWGTGGAFAQGFQGHGPDLSNEQIQQHRNDVPSPYFDPNGQMGEKRGVIQPGGSGLLPAWDALASRQRIDHFSSLPRWAQEMLWSQMTIRQRRKFGAQRMNRPWTQL